jgi:hypothetical protein
VARAAEQEAVAVNAAAAATVEVAAVATVRPHAMSTVSRPARAVARVGAAAVVAARISTTTYRSEKTVLSSGWRLSAWRVSKARTNA